MTYEFSYTQGSRPKWEKVFTATSGETFRAVLTYDNQEDREALTKEQAEEFLNMLLSYAKDCVANFTLLGLEDELNTEPYPIHGSYKEYEWAMETLEKWWTWAYFNDDFDLDHEPDEQITEEPE